MFELIKIFTTQNQQVAIKIWLKRMRQLDPQTKKIPKVRFGKNYVKMRIATAVYIMPWTDNTHGGYARTFKKSVIEELDKVYNKMKNSWVKTGIIKAIGLIEDTPIGELTYTNETERKRILSNTFPLH